MLLSRLPSTLSIWFAAIRPRTLPLAVVSIVSGNALAYQQGQFSVGIFTLTLITALLLQILSNLANDYGDCVKGTDNDARLGPKRTLQQGLVTVDSMKKAIYFTILLTVISGCALLFFALNSFSDMLSFSLLGLLSILAAMMYTLGSKPYGYLGLGDISVLAFFGWLGVVGSYFLQVGELNTVIFLPATASGLLAVAVLNINNLRDIDNDKQSNKLTLAVRLGAKRARIYHLFLLIVPFVLFTLYNLSTHSAMVAWAFVISIPLAIKHGISVYSSADGESLRDKMPQIVKLAVLTNLLFALPLCFVPST